MRLETPRPAIRSVEPADAEGMLQVFGDPGALALAADPTAPPKGAEKEFQS
jgi:hypothetical protein